MALSVKLPSGETANAVPNSALFDTEENRVVQSALNLLQVHCPNDADLLQGKIGQLQLLNANVANCQSLQLSETLGGQERNQASLVAHLTQSDGLAGDLDLPIKATLQRTFLLAKIQLFRAFVTATSGIASSGVASSDRDNSDRGSSGSDESGGDGSGGDEAASAEEIATIATDLREELAQSIYTQMAEDLLLALLRKPCVEVHIKERAAQLLIQIWDNATLEIDDFCPFLEAAWHARNRVHPGLGCLLGTTEYFRLVAEDCPDQFLDFFARDGVSEAENQAFTEFLFGLTWEELETLRGELKAQKIDVCDEQWAAGVLGRPIEHDCDDADNIDPIALYRSYTRRQLAADFRIRSGTPGPRRTAESYLMIYLLDRDELG
ncbi:MAG: hypothetical protein JKY56_03010 [Kofleriaceae bacterium]|nr:hypothetical protein [Kofleriaceae bacterium]